MNEQQFSLQVRHALDESVEKLPYKVTHRLGSARELALSRMQPAPVAVGFASLAAVSPASVSTPSDLPGTGRIWRLAGTVLPILIVVVGIVAMDLWDISEKADELAEVDTAVLTDDVPLDVYTDRGFGVFLKNSRQ